MSRFERVLLVKPAFFSGLGAMMNEIPLGLEYLAAILREKVDQIWLVDFGLERQKPERVFKQLNPDLIGITCQMAWHNNMVRLVKHAKKLLPNVKTIVGGYYPTGFPQLLKVYPEIDYLIRHEGEFPLLELVMGKPEEEIKNLSYRQETKIAHNSIRPTIKDLDSLPFPARDLRRYQYSHLQFPGRIYDTLITSRGCSGRCSFCCEPMMNQSIQRFRDIRRVFEEIEWVWNFYKQTPLKINISDPNFMGRTMADLKRVEELCDLLIAAEFDIEFSCLTRVDVVIKRPTLIEKMVQAGIMSFEMGVESPASSDLKRTEKGVKHQQTVKAVELIRKSGALPLGTMILGFHDQTEHEIKQYPVFAEQIGLIETAFAFVTPLAGTPFFQQMLDLRLITEPDFSNYDYLHPVVRNMIGIEKSRLLQLLGYCYGYFYSQEKLAEGQKFYLDAQPAGQPASTLKDIGVFALKAMSNLRLKDRLHLFSGFIEGRIGAWKARKEKEIPLAADSIVNPSQGDR